MAAVEAVPEATLIVEAGRSNGKKLSCGMMVRTEKVTEVVYKSDLDLVFANYEVF